MGTHKSPVRRIRREWEEEVNSPPRWSLEHTNRVFSYHAVGGDFIPLSCHDTNEAALQGGVEVMPRIAKHESSATAPIIPLKLNGMRVAR